MEMKLLPGKIKQHWFFHKVTKRGVGKQGHGRETRVTWAGPGRGGGSRRAVLVTGWTGQQLVYAGHRKAELRGRFPLWEALMRSGRCVPAVSSPSSHPRLYGRNTNLLQGSWLQSTGTETLVLQGHLRLVSLTSVQPLVPCRHKSERVRLIIISPPPLTETNHFLLKARRERAHLPHKQIVPVTQLTQGSMCTPACCRRGLRHPRPAVREPSATCSPVWQQPVPSTRCVLEKAASLAFLISSCTTTACSMLKRYYNI